MTLPFMTHFKNGERTNFVEKIRRGLYTDRLNDEKWMKEMDSTFPEQPEIYHIIDSMRDESIKIHTIREDKSDRWKEGNKIHFVINNRSPKRFQFAPIIPCYSTQIIDIKWLSIEKEPINLLPMVWIDTIPFYDPAMGVDEGMLDLALNDGFNCIHGFFDYFNINFKGKIIHWTDKRY